MTHPEDNPDLTDYAVGEADLATRIRVQAQLARDPEAREQVEEMQRLAEFLANQLQTEPAPQLTAQQRHAALSMPPRPRAFRWPMPLWIPLAAAAMVLGTMAVLGWWMEGPGRQPKIARDGTTPGGHESPRAFPLPGPEPRFAGKVVNPQRMHSPPGDLPLRISRTPPPPPLGAGEFPGMGQGDIAGDFVVDPGPYGLRADNPYRLTTREPVSTFWVDVDTASYANTRRLLAQGALPSPAAVRVEEMINYFSYDYPAPTPRDEHPLALLADVAGCPWNAAHRLLRLAIKAREARPDVRPTCNLVFLLDVSGPIGQADKWPLVKAGLQTLVDSLATEDRVAILVCGVEGAPALESTPVRSKEKILAALEALKPGPIIPGGPGFQRAYDLAKRHFVPGGINRVVLCTDGGFAVAAPDPASWSRLAAEQGAAGVSLCVLAFGAGGGQDAALETLADKGGGACGYVDTLAEARKLFLAQASQSPAPVARDIRIQVEFNPARVAGYRLIGYERRLPDRPEPSDDRRDAGDLPAGSAVTALYEIVPAGGKVPASAPAPGEPALRYQLPVTLTAAAASGEMLTLRLRYRQPTGDVRGELVRTLTDDGRPFTAAPVDFKFAAAVASFGMILRQSPHRGTGTLDGVIALADSTRGPDRDGYRAEFVHMVRRARTLSLTPIR